MVTRFSTRALSRRAVAVLVVAVLGVTGCGKAGVSSSHERQASPTGHQAAPSDAGADVRAESILMQPADGRSPTLAVVVIHGGSWGGSAPELIARAATVAALLPARGWAAVVAAYRAGPGGLEDLLIQYDDLRRRLPGTPICLVGESAGGHLALMIAARRSSVRCVINEAGPTDLAGLRSGPSPSPAGYEIAARVFGEQNLGRWSPIRSAGRIRAHIFQVVAANDRLVPPIQGERLNALVRHGTLRVLNPGSTFFVHSTVDAAQLAEVRDEEIEFLADFAKNPARE